MALVFFKKIKNSGWLLIGLFVFGFIIRWYMYNTHVRPFQEEGAGILWYKWIYYPTYSRLDGLLSGVGIAAIFRFKPAVKEWMNAYGDFFFLLGLFILTAAYIICLQETSLEASVFGFFLVSTGYAALVVSAVSSSSFLCKLRSAFTVRTAALSYAIYLTHKIIIHITQLLFDKLNIEKDSNSMLLICIVTCFAGAWLLNMLVERPFLKLRNKMLE